jgi:hypothetical protein
MQTAEQCKAYAAEYLLLAKEPDISSRRATLLVNISRSWTTLAHRLERLAEIIKDASK